MQFTHILLQTYEGSGAGEMMFRAGGVTNVNGSLTIGKAMCNYCEPNGWKKKCCNFCGIGTPTFISISIAVPHGSDFPYSSTDLCDQCWLEYGMQAALDHNAQCRNDLSEDY